MTTGSTKYLFDTNAVIYMLDHDPGRNNKSDKWAEKAAGLLKDDKSSQFISVLTKMEALIGSSAKHVVDYQADREAKAIADHLEQTFTVLPMDNSILADVVNLRRKQLMDYKAAEEAERKAAAAKGQQFEKPAESKKKLPDCIIAATAKAHGMTVVTANATDFKDVPVFDIRL